MAAQDRFNCISKAANSAFVDQPVHFFSSRFYKAVKLQKKPEDLSLKQWIICLVGDEEQVLASKTLQAQANLKIFLFALTRPYKTVGEKIY